MSIAGTEIHAKNAIPTGAPTRVPSCHSNFFFLDHGFLPQKVQPENVKKCHVISRKYAGFLCTVGPENFKKSR